MARALANPRRVVLRYGAVITGVLGWGGGLLTEMIFDDKIAWEASLVISLSTFAVVVVIALVHGYQTMRRLQLRLYVRSKRNASRLRDARGKHAQLQRRCEALTKEFSEAPDRFLSFSESIRTFETRLSFFSNLTFGGLLEAHRGRPALKLENFDKAWRKLDDAYQAVLKSICDTAMNVIDSQKTQPLKSSASLTLFTSEVARQATYRVIYRSGGSGDRDKDDTRLSESPVLVVQNWIYDKLADKLAAARTQQDSRKCYELIEDMDKELRELEARQTERKHYPEPAADAGKHYQSCLVVPITWLRDERSMAGVLCIDSMEKNAYQAGYEIKIMIELAHYASSVVGSHAAAKGMWEEMRSGASVFAVTPEATAPSS